MNRLTIAPLTLIMCVIGSITLASCDILKKDVDDEDGGGLSQLEVSEFFFENQDAPFVMFDAFARVLAALEGSQVDGVSFTPRVGSKNSLIYDGVIGLDFDFNGDYEVNVIGFIDFPGTEANLDNGAILFITDVTGASVNGTATADISASGPGGALLDGTGSFGVSGDPPVDLDFEAVVNFFQSSIDGFSDVTFGNWDAQVFFEPAQFAPYQVRVVTADDEYVIGADLF